MPNDNAGEPQYVTKAQLDDVEKKIAPAAEAAGRAGAKKVIDNINELIGPKIEEGVKNALEAQQVSVAVQTGKKESNVLKVLLALIPALATLIAVILGFGVWLKQKDIEKTINDQDRNLTTRLAITQEFYKRKFDIYEKAHQQMTTLLAALQNYRVDPNAITRAFDSLSELDSYSKTNQLYMTKGVADSLSEVWGAASDWMQNGGSIDGVTRKIEGAEKKMKEELDAENITKLTPCANNNTNANTNSNNANANGNVNTQ